MWGPLIYEYSPRPTAFHPTRTVVIIDILLHTTIAAAAVWQFEASLSEANCFCGPPFCGAPVRPNTLICLNPPLYKAAPSLLSTAQSHCHSCYRVVCYVHYSIEYRVLEYSNITATNVTLKETDRRLADYFHVRLHFRRFCILASA